MGLAKVVVVGSGVFGTLAAKELRARGHVATNVSRRTGVDMREVPALMRALERADAVIHAAGPFHAQEPTVARAAAALCIPYADISDDRAFSAGVRALDATSPLMTGMSTTPAVVEALHAVARRRDARSPATAAMFVGGGNAQGPATMEFAARSRAAGRPIPVDFPVIGKRRAYPARASFDGEFYVSVGGIAGLAWGRRKLFRAIAPYASRFPRLSLDTAGALIVFVGDQREGVYALEEGQRLAVLPAVWAIEEALAGRAPSRSLLSDDWVDPDALLAFLAANGFERVSA